MPIPRRQINPKLNTGDRGGVGQFSDDIAGAVLPGAGLDGVIGVERRPEAEAVVVLGGENDAGNSGGFGDGDPVGGVEGGGSEDRRVNVAGSPLGIGEGVGAEVEEEGDVGEVP